MKFEVGKYYKHTTGRSAKILGAVTGSVYSMGPVILVAEMFGDGSLQAFGDDETSAENWSECPPWCQVQGYNVEMAPEAINNTCVNHGCPECGGSGFLHGPRATCHRGDPFT